MGESENLLPILGISAHASVCSVCVGCLFLRTPSRAPYRTPSACANRAAYPDPPPVVPDPESIDARASYRGRHSTIARLSPARIVSVAVLVKPLPESPF